MAKWLSRKMFFETLTQTASFIQHIAARSSRGTIDVLLYSRLSLSLVLVFGSLSSSGNNDGKEAVAGEITVIGDATHLEFRGKNSWSYDLRNSADRTQVVVQIPPVDEQTVKRLEEWKGDLVRKIKVNKNGTDGSYEVTFDLASNVSSFDYLTEEPSRLVIDFYRAPGSTVEAVVPNKNIVTPPVAKTSPATQSKTVKMKRQPAGTDYITVPANQPTLPAEGAKDDQKYNYGIYDGADTSNSRFTIRDEDINKKSIQLSRREIFLRFPILELGYPYLNTLRSNPPIYEVKPEDTDENKIARLLVVLFNEKKAAMFAKTLNHFRQKYPRSKLNELIGYMEADLHYHLWRSHSSLDEFENAMVRYRQLVERYPNSPLTERTFLLMGYSYLERSDALGALKIVQRFLSGKPTTKYRDKAQLIVAAAFLKLNRFDEALDSYRQISQNALHRRTAVEADYLAGDVFLKKGDFEPAIQTYKKALESRAQEGDNYPNAQFNIAESYFWTSNYKESMNQFIHFLRKYPTHPFGGYAMTRLGEILEILGAPEKKVMGAFLESYFRYKTTPGGALARVRILTSKMKDMKENELEEAFKELNHVVEAVSLDKTDQFVTVKIADGHFSRGEFDLANDALITFHQKNPQSTNIVVFQDRIARNITSKIKDRVDHGDLLAALKEHDKYKDTWLKRTNRLDVVYYVGQAYERLGVYTEAERLFRSTINHLYSRKDLLDKEFEDPFQFLPSADSLNLRLAAVFARKADYHDANNFLKEIRQPDVLTQGEQIELVGIAAEVAEARGQIPTAINFLKKISDNWKGNPEMVAGPYLKLAELQLRSKQLEPAMDSVTKILNLVEDTGKVSAEHHFAALSMQGKLLVQKGRRAEAIAVFRSVLKKFSEGRDLSSLRYQTGKLLMDAGDVRGAKEIWGPLQLQQNLWANLVSEQSEDQEWRSRYKKYIDRIPAMESVNK